MQTLESAWGGEKKSTGRALTDLKVVSFAQVISAPSATRMLCDLGADVIKIEPPGGDVMRRIRPFKKDRRGKLQSGIFVALNCGQRSLCLDLRTEKGCAVARRLILDWADVVVANFTTGTLDKFGLNYESICKQKPGIIYGLISGYGQSGPWSRRRAYDVCVQSECGITAQNGSWRGKPHRVGFSVLDYLAGRDLVIGVLAALRSRDATGQGMLVDCCLYNSGVSVLEDAIPGYDLEGVIPEPMGSRHPSACPHGLYQTRDGYVNIIAIDNRLWSRLCEMMGDPGLQERAGFRTAPERIGNHEEVDATIERWTLKHTTGQVLALMEEHGLPHGHLCSVRDVIESEQTRYWEMAPQIDQPLLGPVRINGCPVKLSDADTDVRGAAPLLGEHNQEVLCDLLGFSGDEYRDLCEEEVLDAEIDPSGMPGDRRRSA